MPARRRRSQAASLGWRRRRARGEGRRRYGPRPRERSAALAATYPARQPPRKRLIALYMDAGGRLDGAETFALVVRQDWLLCRLRGLGARTTGPQRVRGLELAGRPRVRRTVQRHRLRAAELGVLRCVHVKRGRAAAGFRDVLRVEPVVEYESHRCHPAFGSASRGPSGLPAGALAPGGALDSPAAAGGGGAGNGEIGRAPPADTEAAPQAAPNGSTEEGMKRSAGGGADAAAGRTLGLREDDAGGDEHGLPGEYDEPTPEEVAAYEQWRRDWEDREALREEVREARSRYRGR